MATSFGETNIFLTIGLTTQQRYPMGQTFRRNRSISHSFQETSIFVFCNFCIQGRSQGWYDNRSDTRWALLSQVILRDETWRGGQRNIGPIFLMSNVSVDPGMNLTPPFSRTQG